MSECVPASVPVLLCCFIQCAQFTLNPYGLILWLSLGCVNHVFSHDSFDFMLDLLLALTFRPVCGDDTSHIFAIGYSQPVSRPGSPQKKPERKMKWRCLFHINNSFLDKCATLYVCQSEQFPPSRPKSFVDGTERARAQPRTLCTHFQYETLPTRHLFRSCSDSLCPLHHRSFCDCGSRFSGSIFRFSNQRHVDSNILITGSRPCVSCALIPSRKLYIYCRKSGSYFVSQKFITNIFVRLFRWTSVSALALIQFDAIFIQIIHVVFGSCSQKCRDHNSLDVLDGEKTLRPELKRLINTCQMSHWLITHSRSADSSTQSVVNFVMDMIMNRNQNCCVSANGLSY